MLAIVSPTDLFPTKDDVAVTSEEDLHDRIAKAQRDLLEQAKAKIAKPKKSCRKKSRQNEVP